MIILKEVLKDLEDGSYGFIQFIHPISQAVLAEIESDVLNALVEGEVESTLSELDWGTPLECVLTTKAISDDLWKQLCLDAEGD
jgi:hypothetical protein